MGDLEGQGVILDDDLCGQGLCGSLGTTRVVDESLATSEFPEDLGVDVPGLSTSDGPLAVDDKDGDSTNATLPGFLDLIFDYLSILV